MQEKLITDNAAGTAWLSLTEYKVQAMILMIIAFVFYCNTFTHEAAFDDRMAVTHNDYVQAGTAGIKDILTHDAYQSYLEQKNGGNQLAGGRYRPLSLVTFAIEQQVMGVHEGTETPDERDQRVNSEMGARHVVNVLLYMLSLATVLYMLRRVVFPGEPVAAFIAALVFAIHPVHTEVVANVKSRDEILSVLFIALTFVKVWRYAATNKAGDAAQAGIFYLLALLSKEYAVTLLALVPAGMYALKGETPAKSLKSVIPLLAPFALYMLMRLAAVTGPAEGAEQNVMNYPYLYATGAQKGATIMLVLLDYLKLLVFPDTLVADYSYNQVPYTDFGNPAVWLSVALYASLAAAMVVLLRKRHVMGFAIAFYLGNLLLVSNIFFNIGAPMGERLIYHSSLGFAIAAAWMLYKGFGKLNIATISRWGMPGFLVALVMVSGFKTVERNKDWKNDNVLSLADVQKAPSSVLLNNNAAAACMALAKEHKDDVRARTEWLRKATGYFDKAIAINPRHYLAWMNRGLCYYNMGQPEKALRDWDTVRAHEPGYEHLQQYLAVASQYFFSQGIRCRNEHKTDSAILNFSKSADAVPRAPEPYIEAARTYMMTGQKDAAMNAINKALNVAPNSTEALRLREEAVK